MRKEYHHIGIPTSTRRPDEIPLEGMHLFITDANKSAHRIERLRFEPGCPLPKLLWNVPHVAFTVDNLDAALAGQKVIVDPFVPMPGLRVAFIEEDGVPVEYLEFAK